MVLHTSIRTGSRVLVKNRLSQNIAAIRHILPIYLSPLHFRSIFLYVDTHLPAFLQKSFFLITNGEMLRLKNKSPCDIRSHLSRCQTSYHRGFSFTESLHFEFSADRALDEWSVKYLQAAQEKHSGWIRADRFHFPAAQISITCHLRSAVLRIPHLPQWLPC